MIKFRNFLYLILLSVCALFSACSEKDDANLENSGKLTKVTFSLSTRASSGVPHNPVDDSELINDYCVVFADESGTVVEVFNKDCSPVELDEFTLELAPGSYRVYAFANIPNTYIQTLGLDKGTKITGFPTSLSSVYYAVPSLFNASSLLPVNSYGGNIPMTSIEAQRITVSERATQSFGIEVRRLFAKVQFNFTNITSEDLTLRAQRISNLTLNAAANKGSIRLMNYNDATIQLSDDARSATLSHNYGSSPLQLTKNGGTATQSFYVLESIADQLTNSFLLDFDIVKKGESTNAETPKEDYMRYALTDPNTLTAIRRNDWIVIPITISDWQMRLEARTYPPIGGYPEAEIDEDESNEFVVRFQGGGDFSIRPFIRKFGDGSDWFGIDNTAKISGTPTITVEDTDNLFTTTPTLSTTGEIRGKMAVASDKHATITISINVITATTPSKVLKTLTRKIFITQK